MYPFGMELLVKVTQNSPSHNTDCVSNVQLVMQG